MPGPLTGTTILELAGIGPGPFAGMMLADMGADVIRIDRPGGNPSAEHGHSVLFRSRRSLALDLKHDDGVAVLLRLCEQADALFEGFRPGVVERLGVGPEPCLARNPALVYGRITGWGREGPLATAAGHDVNYIALAGALQAIGTDDDGPVIPLNLVGDFGGGGMLLAFGVVCGLLHARVSGEGQVVDAAMLDGVAAQMAMFAGLQSEGLFTSEREAHQLDGGAHYYNTYETRDGEWISIGAIEPKFYSELCERLDLDEDIRANQHARHRWPEFRHRVAEVIQQRTRAEWDEILAGTDVCYAPVLDISAAGDHPHHQSRGTFMTVDGVPQHAPAPRFSRAEPDSPTPAVVVGENTVEVLREHGFDQSEINGLLEERVIADDGAD